MPGKIEITPKEEENVVVLAAGRSELNYWADLLNFRELFIVLAWRDISIRYKQAAIGVAWAVIRPLLTMVIFTVIFGRIAKLPTEGEAPYVIMVFAGMLPWFLFSTILTEASNSLVGNARLISKVYFPRLMVPTAAGVVALVDFLINCGLFIILMMIFGFTPNWQVIFLPFFILMAILASLGPALLFTALNVKYRDFKYIIPFIVQFGLYVSPVGFASAVIPDNLRLFYSFNPVVGVIDGFRWCLLGGNSELYLPSVFVSCAVIAFFLWAGITYFRSTEKTFADVI